MNVSRRFAYRRIVFIAIFILALATATTLSAWTGPTQSPPNGNVSAPVNVGSTDQVKNAGLSLDALVVFGNTLLSGVSNYLNFGTTAGSTGYGIRDNEGAMEFKNSGGSWAAIGGSSGPTPWLVSGNNVYYSGGNVGIGTASPAEPLHVVGTGRFTDLTASRLVATDSNSSLTAGTGILTAANLQTSISGTTGTAGSLVFSSGPTLTGNVSMPYGVWNSNGAVGIGTVSPAYSLDVAGWIRAGGWGYGVLTSEVRASTPDGHLVLGPRQGVVLIEGDTQANGYMIITGSGGLDVYGPINALRQNNNPSIIVSYNAVGIDFAPGDNAHQSLRFRNASGAVIGSVSHNASGTGYNTTSDYRVKEHVTPLTGALGRLSLLKPSRFNFKIEPGMTLDGFLAHEVADVVPEAVTGEKDAVDEKGDLILQQLDMSKLIPLLTASIQELKAENNELRLELQELRTLIERK